MATSATVKKSKSDTNTSEVTNTSRVAPLDWRRCMKISATSVDLAAAIPSAIASAHLPRCAVPVR